MSGRRSIGWGSVFAALAIALLAVVPAGCGGGGSGSSGEATGNVELTGSAAPTGGKALSFAATTTETLRGAGGLYALELRGSDVDGDNPDYVDPQRCTLPPCTWDVVHGPAGTYEFRAFLIDVPAAKDAGQSEPVQLE